MARPKSSKNEHKLREKVYQSSANVEPQLRTKPDEPVKNKTLKTALRAVNGKDYSKAEKILINVIKSTKDKITLLMALETLANVYRITKNLKALDKILTKISKFRGNYGDYVEHGNVLMILKDYEKALDKYINSARVSIDKEQRARSYALAYFASILSGKTDPELLVAGLDISIDDTIKVMLNFGEKVLPEKKKPVYRKNLLEIMDRYSRFKAKLSKLKKIRKKKIN